MLLLLGEGLETSDSKFTTGHRQFKSLGKTRLSLGEPGTSNNPMYCSNSLALTLLLLGEGLETPDSKFTTGHRQFKSLGKTRLSLGEPGTSNNPM